MVTSFCTHRRRMVVSKPSYELLRAKEVTMLGSQNFGSKIFGCASPNLLHPINFDKEKSTFWLPRDMAMESSLSRLRRTLTTKVAARERQSWQYPFLLVKDWKENLLIQSQAALKMENSPGWLLLCSRQSRKEDRHTLSLRTIAATNASTYAVRMEIYNCPEEITLWVNVSVSINWFSWVFE